MKTGDLLFFTPIDAVGDAIAFYTHGPFSHVAVAVSGVSCVEAVAPVIKVDAPDMSRIKVCELPPANLPNVEQAVAWLMKQVGDPYSFYDIVDAFMAPYSPLYINTKSSYDCSCLAYHFLIQAGYPFAFDPTAQTPDQISPNGLARLIGFIK